MKNKNNQPAHEIRKGSVKATIWLNESAKGANYSVSVSRFYRDQEGWKSTESFGRNHLYLLIKVVDAAHDWIYANPIEVTSQTTDE